MKKPTLSINKLKEEGLFCNSDTNRKVISHERILRLKFFFDNSDRDQINKLASFLVESDEKAIKLLVQFENEGAKIRAAFLTLNNPNYTKMISTRLDFSNHPYYIFLKGSD